MSKSLKILFVRIFFSFRNGLKKLSCFIIPSNLAVLELAQNYWISKAIGTAAELEIADFLVKGPKDINKLAVETKTDVSALYRLMRALSGIGIFKEKNNRVFEMSKLALPLAKGPNSVKHMIIHQTSKYNWKMVSELDLAVRRGNYVAGKVLGEDIFSYLKHNPQRNELYNKAMSDSAEFFSKTLVRFHHLPDFNTLVDVGGGEGILLGYLLRNNKKAKGVLFDFPHVISRAESNFKRLGVAKRASIVTGNFLESIPVKADTYLFKNIFHAFDDKTCVRILRNVEKAMSENAKILIVEMDLKRKNKYSWGKLFDLQMLVGVEGGRERTKDNFKNLLENTGFEISKIIKTVTPFHIIVINRVDEK